MEPNKDKIKTMTDTGLTNKPIREDIGLSTIFKKDKNLWFIHQKIKKLASAVYIITNFFDDSEPAKWSIRKLSADLLKYNIILSKTDVPNAREVENKIQETVLEVVSLLEIASFAGLVSEMNLSVLERESKDLLSKISQTLNGNKQNDLLTNKDFFMTTESFDPGLHMQGQTSADSMKDKLSVLDKENMFTGQDLMTHTTSPEDKRQKLKDFSPVIVKRNKRQSAIINVLKRKKEIMIKDISSIINDCSEKTIQRELSSLVEGGIIKKEGERRWTRYSLV